MNELNALYRTIFFPPNGKHNIFFSSSFLSFVPTQHRALAVTPKINWRIIKRNLLTRSSMCIYLSTFDSLLMGIRNLFVFSVHRTRGVCAAPYLFYYLADDLYRNSSGCVPVLVPLEADRKCMKFKWWTNERKRRRRFCIFTFLSWRCGCCCCCDWCWWWFTLKFRVCSRKLTRLFIGWVYLIYTHSFIIM